VVAVVVVGPAGAIVDPLVVVGDDAVVDDAGDVTVEVEGCAGFPELEQLASASTPTTLIATEPNDFTRMQFMAVSLSSKSGPRRGL